MGGAERFLYEDKSRQRLIQELLTIDELVGRRVFGFTLVG